MKQFLNFIFPLVFTFLLEFILFIIGGILFFYPNMVSPFIQLIFVGILFLKSIGEFWAYFVQRDMDSRSRFYQGIGFFAMALIFLINQQARIFSLSVIISLFFLVDAVIKLAIAIQYKLSGLPNWWHTAVMAGVSFAFIFVFFRQDYRYFYLIRLAGIFIWWQVLTSLLDILFRGNPWEQMKMHWRINLLYIQQNSYDNSFLPARWFKRVEDTIEAKNDLQKFLQTEDKRKDVSLDGCTTIKVTIHSWNGDIMTMKGHSDIVIDGKCYSYGNYDANSSKLGGNLSDGVLVVTPEKPYTDYCLDEEQKILLQYTLRINQEQQEKLMALFDRGKAELVPWLPPIIQDEQAMDDASKLYRKLSAINPAYTPQFYKFKSGQFKYYFVLNTNCIRFVENILTAIGFINNNNFCLRTPGDYIDFFEKQLASATNCDIIERKVKVDFTKINIKE